MAKKKKKPDVPPIPKGAFQGFIWFITYHTGKFIAIVASILAIIGFYATFSMVIKEDPKTGEKKIKEIKIENIDVDIKVGKPKGK